jgi:hypothetical protein
MGIKMIGQNKITDFVDCILFMLYYPSNCEFESHSRRVHSIQHYVIKFLSDLSFATGRWFSPGTPISSTNKTDRHDIAEILLKMTLSTIKQANKHTHIYIYIFIRLKIKPNSVRIRYLSCQIFVLTLTGFELTPLIHCCTNRLALCSASYTTRPHPLY